MKKPSPTVFSVKIPANDAVFVFSPLSMREMDIFTQRESTVASDPIAKRDLYRELIAKCLSKAGDATEADDLSDLDSPTFNTLFNEVMKAHGMTLKADTAPGGLKASQSS